MKSQNVEPSAVLNDSSLNPIKRVFSCDPSDTSKYEDVCDVVQGSCYADLLKIPGEF